MLTHNAVSSHSDPQPSETPAVLWQSDGELTITACEHICTFNKEHDTKSSVPGLAVLLLRPCPVGTLPPLLVTAATAPKSNFCK